MGGARTLLLQALPPCVGWPNAALCDATLHRTTHDGTAHTSPVVTTAAASLDP